MANDSRVEHTQVLVFVADQPNHNGDIMTADILRRLHDGERYFWDEIKRILWWRGPAHELHTKPPQYRYACITVPNKVKVCLSTPTVL